MESFLQRWVPAFDWLRNYKTEHLRGDVVAGVTTAVMLIPQAMAYALLAGLPPVIGLYASIVPLLIYAIFGTSRQLAVGPVAMVALLVSSGIASIATPGDMATYIRLTVLLSLLVGIIQLGMGVFRLGFITIFLSHPVISGFTSAAALIIGFSQLKHIVGLNLPRSENILKTIYLTFEQAADINPLTLILGLTAIVFLIMIRKISPLIPGALIMVVISSLVAWFWDLQKLGVGIVGEIPAGLPPFTVPAFQMEELGALLPIALTISFVGFMESIAVGKQIATEKRYEIEANQELVALGAANLFGAFFRAMPVTGGFSRTAVNKDAGANTSLAGIITALVVGVVLMFFTPLLYFLPKSILGAIIMVAVFGLIDLHEVTYLWKVKKDDLALLAITFFATLGLGVMEGIFAGIGISMLWFVVKTTRPHYAVLGKLPNRNDYRNVKRHITETDDNILVIRFDAQFYYGNVSFLKETLKKAELEKGTQLRAIVIDAGSVNQLDSSAVRALEEITREYRLRNIDLYFANVKGPVLDVMKRSGFHEMLGEDGYYKNVHEAVEAVPPDG